jgi:predicted DNA-binding protein
MPKMTHRTTFALDEATAQRLKRLSRKWGVSQAEVVRRSVERSEKDLESEDSLALLDELHISGNGLTEEAASDYLSRNREIRKSWRSE